MVTVLQIAHAVQCPLSLLCFLARLGNGLFSVLRGGCENQSCRCLTRPHVRLRLCRPLAYLRPHSLMLASCPS
ncbi:hypothetical protein BD311DRAFT_759600 [Dichomitus squalens]|uniref:Secreted protein n=1 Tax=Dichomitus squalens TaxID=114155 RepID=A0A4Q9MLM4_9APHY|nr:hypothetical protein BD311DRAFT_759600 [Dichomitus squalens]